MEAPTTVSDLETPALTLSQEMRARALRRFNWFTIYLPLGFLALVLMLVIVWMLLTGMPDEGGSARRTLSGGADAVIVLASLPPLLLCAILPIAFLVTIIQARSRGVAPIKAIRRSMWRLEAVLVSFNERAWHASQRIADPLVGAYSRTAFISTLAKLIKTSLKRS